MSYIEREAVHNLVKDLKKYRWTSPCSIESFETVNSEHLTELIDFIPTADVVEVRHGTWYHGTENGAIYAKCSACGRKMNYYCYGYAYCALCGAKMDGERR